MADQGNQRTTPDEATGDDGTLPEPVYVNNQFNDRGLVEQINKSGQRLRRATERVAQVLNDSPALGTTERSVTLRRAGDVNTGMEALWWAIARHGEATSFENYFSFIDRVLCPNPKEERGPRDAATATLTDQMRRFREMCHLPGVDVYELLKTSTEVFLLLNCGTCPDDDGLTFFGIGEPAEGGSMNDPLGSEVDRLGSRPGEDGNARLTLEQAKLRLQTFLGKRENNYLASIVQGAFPAGKRDVASPFCMVDSVRMEAPCLLELIWSYWMEEGMLNQTVAAITRRFQNVRRAGRGPDPLAELELDPLRPLNGFLWGYLQDEPNRLSVVRRAYEYNHHYGLTLYGRAVPALRPADPRARFLEAFHNLLRQAAAFYREDNDTTVIADAFPALNSLKEVHLVLSEGAHNQFRDLPWTSRVEMLMQQWLLARPELREFLRGRHMVAYPEPWMGSVDSMKRLQGWTDTSVIHFRDLARFGERLLLSIRYGNWSAVADQDVARAWLRYWRGEIQGYIHAYYTATGVNLSDNVVEVRDRADARYLQPSYHLRNRMLSARRAARELR
ncbi:MAG TPA: hypothetical protein VGB92_02685 [Longimicrobium sp.]|jgi:hypothetical protein